MAFPEVFDALKDVGKINIRINLKVSRLSIMNSTVFRVLLMCEFVDMLFRKVRTSLANYLASPLGRP
jgi:hypothetical protein